MPQVEVYRVETQDPGAHPAELLNMLHRRDGIAEELDQLSPEKLEILREADEHLLRNAAAFYAVLSQGIDFAEERSERDITSKRWWWYLDVIDELPAISTPSESTKPSEPAQSAAY